MKDLKDLTNEQKSLLMYVFFKVKAATITSNFPRINSSREKDNEIYRWRFAYNNMLLYESDLLIFKLNYLKSQIENFIKKDDIKNYNACMIELEETQSKLEKVIKDRERIIAENKSFLSYDISFNDLNLDFDGVVEYLGHTPEEKNKTMKAFKDEGKTFYIKTNNEDPETFGK